MKLSVKRDYYTLRKRKVIVFNFSFHIPSNLSVDYEGDNVSDTGSEIKRFVLFRP